MAENAVIFRDNQEVQAADFNNLQTWLGTSLDDVVLDAIEPGLSYTGFGISKSAPTQISVAPGRVYSKGQVYARVDTVTLDTFNVLPVTQKKQIAVVAWGTTITQDTQPRDFIIDADTGEAQPQSVDMTTTRYANVDIVPGVESAAPQYPTIDATDCLIGYVLCDPTGIVSYQQSTTDQLDNISDLSNKITALNNWASTVNGQIATLTSALAALASQLKNYTLLTDFQKLVTLVNQIWDLIHQPPAYAWYGTDYFLDTSQSFTTGNVDGAYFARVEEGLRFPGGTGSTNATMGLLNPQDPGAMIAADGFILPTPSGSRMRMDCSFPDFPWIEERILQYIYTAFTLRHLYPSRHRFRCGPPWPVCPPAEVWWYQAQLDPTVRILSFLYETWEIVEWGEIASHQEDDIDWPRHQFGRWQYYWRDYVDLPYWSKVFDNFDHSGQHIAQTFLNSQDGWLSGITTFMNVATAAPLTVLISQCDDQGQPDHLNQTIRRVVMQATDVTAGFTTPIQIGDIGITPHGLVDYFPGVTTKTLPIPWGGPIEMLYPGWWAQVIPVYIFPLRISFPPVFLQAGKRYSIHFVSTGDHRFCISDRWECLGIHQGGYWVNGSGGLYLWPSLTSPKSLRFALHYATWGQWQGNANASGGGIRMELQLQPLQMAGGIGGIDVLADTIIPPVCDLSYQIQLAGQWQPFSEDPNTPQLSSLPPLLPFKAVFTGTTDLMPGISLTKSQVTLTGGQSNNFHHISQPITIAAACTHIKVVGHLIGLDTSHHTCVCSIHFGTTHAMPDVVGDAAQADGSISRTWTFNQSIAALGSFYVEMDGTTDGAIPDRFIVASRVAYAD
jgi:hypothetical protein